MNIILPKELVNELDNYLGQIKKVDIVNRIKDEIDLELEHRYDGNADLRLFCLRVFFRCIGLNLSISNANQCSLRFCKYTLKAYIDGGYRQFNLSDRRTWYQIEEMEDYLVEGLIAYRSSAGYREGIFRNITNLGNSATLNCRVDGLTMLYPKEPKCKLVKYALCYMESYRRFRPDCDSFLDCVKEIISYDIDFFKVTDMLCLRKDKVGIVILKAYLEDVSIIKDYFGVALADVFSTDVPGFAQTEVVAFAIKKNVMVSAEVYRTKPDMSAEYIYWRAEGLSIESYFKQGYRSIKQLRLIRRLLQSGLDPDDFNISPNMSSEAMAKRINRQLCCKSVYTE